MLKIWRTVGALNCLWTSILAATRDTSDEKRWGSGQYGLRKVTQTTSRLDGRGLKKWTHPSLFVLCKPWTGSKYPSLDAEPGLKCMSMASFWVTEKCSLWDCTIGLPCFGKCRAWGHILWSGATEFRLTHPWINVIFGSQGRSGPWLARFESPENRGWVPGVCGGETSKRSIILLVREGS